MDNAEAIRRIKDHIRVHHIGEYPHIKIAEALNMAISALANDNNVGHKVEVVRCKDCRFWHEDTVSCDFVTADTNWYAEDYCSYGERKDND